MKYFILLILCLLLSGEPSAQDKWQVSLWSGVISSEFFIDPPLGYKVEGKLYYDIFENVQLSFSTGFNKWERKIGAGGNKYKSIPVLLGIKQFFPLETFSPYFGGELGIYFIKRNFIFQSYEPSTRFESLYSLVLSEPRSENVTKFGINFHMGTTIRISELFDADLRITYHNIFYDFLYLYHPKALTSTGKIKFYGISLGLNYKI